MAAKGLAPGLKPGDTLAVVVALADSHDNAIAKTAQDTLKNLPAPLLNGALGGALHALVLERIGPSYAREPAMAEKILRHPDISIAAVIAIAKSASEPVCELIATNEERLLQSPDLIEALYRNNATRMSTADRIIELAVRHGMDIPGIPAFKEVAAAIQMQLIPEASAEPTYDDIAYAAAERASAQAERTNATGEVEDTHEVDETSGEERVKKHAKEAEEKWHDLSTTAKMRRALTSSKATDRLLALRDSSPLVRKAAVKSDAFTDAEAEGISARKNTYEDVLREIASSPTLVRRHKVKVNLVMNPRTPAGVAQKFLPFLREHELRQAAASKDVQGAVSQQAKQLLQRKQK
jgi:adenosyl cobinamide kinase/adenosyl cobinamide phosphate guanylyltransferase